MRDRSPRGSEWPTAPRSVHGGGDSLCYYIAYEVWISTGHECAHLTDTLPATKPMNLLKVPVHPLLVAAYPVVFLFAENIDQQVSVGPLWAPLALALGLALLLLVGFFGLWREARRAALAASLLVALFFTYGHVQQAVAGVLPSHWPLVAGWGLLGAGAIALLARGGAWIGSATGFLNVASALAVSFSAAVIVGHLVRPFPPLETGGLTAGAPGERPPDIYYLVPDRYAGAEALRRYYGYDNAAFLDALAARGFYVAADSHANYPRTGPSLLSAMSMEYLDAAALRVEQSGGGDESPINRRLAGPLPVQRLLKEAGYRYIHLGNVWEPTRTNVDADVVIAHEAGSEFGALLGRTTLLAAVLPAPQDPENPWDDLAVRRQSLAALDRLAETGDAPSPRFVFAHLLLPHPPYVFNADGSLPTEEERRRRGETASYIEQLEYTNARLLELIDRLLEAPDPPVIIIQADEGPWPDRFRESGAGFDWRQATDDELEEKFSILSAFHLPGADPEEAGLHRSITPVNTFRVVLNAYFGTDLALHPDRVYAHTSYRRFLDLFEITDRLSGRRARP